MAINYHEGFFFEKLAVGGVVKLSFYRLKLNPSNYFSNLLSNNISVATNELIGSILNDKNTLFGE
jgi:hypothetical protein